MRSLDSSLIVAKNDFNQDSPWLLLVELEYEDWELLYYKNLNTSFHENTTVTGGTSGATADVLFVIPLSVSTGYLVIENRSTTNFSDGETITDDHTGTQGEGVATTPLPSGSAVFRFARNPESIEYGGNTYYPMDFAITPYKEADGEFPNITLSISNIGRDIAAYALKADGMIGSNVRVVWIYHGDLSADPAIDECFSILKCEFDDRFVQFTIGLRNPLRQLFPRFRYSRKLCRHAFRRGRNTAGNGNPPTSVNKSWECTYGSFEGETETTCTKRLEDCYRLDDFGGFPGIPGGYFDED